MSTDQILSDFELKASQSISNSLKKAVSFRKVNSRKTSFAEALLKLRDDSFFIILTDKTNHLLIALDQAIIGAWLGQAVPSIGENEFAALKESTRSLILEIQNSIDYSGTCSWTPLRWETHPNFLAVLSAQTRVCEFEFNIHIARNTGKMWIITDRKIT